VNAYHPLARKARGRVALVALAVCVLMLGAAFFRLQILQAGDYAVTAQENLIRRVDLPAPRGTIFDRYGRIVAENVPGYAITLLPAPLDSLRATLHRLQAVVELTDEEVEDLMTRAARDRGLPLEVTPDASFEEVSLLEEVRSEFPQVFVESRPRRLYHGGEAVGHVMGYIGQITEDELELPEFQDARRYSQGVIVGKTGIEREYEALLQGRPGTRYVEVDARRRIVGDIAGRTDPAEPGQDIRLSLDLTLQEFIHDIFPDSLSGAVVALDPADGSILALYSAPSFDPNEFVGGIDPQRWRELNDAETTPLYNRAVLGRFAPASTWKVATAAIALDLGLVDPYEHMEVPCTGAFQYGNRVARCWDRQGHGDINLLEAIQHSCDVYFYQLGLRIGLQRLLDEADRVGFADRCGIDLPQENPGIFPRDLSFWEERFGYTPREGEVLNLAIGQGPNSQTPLKMAQFYVAIARDGTAPAPRLFPNGPYPAPEGWELSLTPEALDMMREGLRRVTAPGGTAYLSSLQYWDLMGKTGTGQNPLSVRGLAEDHAWFAGMAGPKGGEPEVVVVVLVEYGGGGSSRAAPIMAKTADFYLRQKHGIPIDTIQTLREHILTGPWPSWAPVPPPRRTPDPPAPTLPGTGGR
jgi:penicillin-binding protein 2